MYFLFSSYLTQVIAAVGAGLFLETQNALFLVVFFGLAEPEGRVLGTLRRRRARIQPSQISADDRMCVIFYTSRDMIGASHGHETPEDRLPNERYGKKSWKTTFLRSGGE